MNISKFIRSTANLISFITLLNRVDNYSKTAIKHTIGLNILDYYAKNGFVLFEVLEDKSPKTSSKSGYFCPRLAGYVGDANRSVGYPETKG